MQRCPSCSQGIQGEAKECLSCGRILTPAAAGATVSPVPATNRSDLRLLEKVCHVGALAWTLICLPALIRSLIFPTRAEGNAAALFETSLAFYSVFWFVPVAGLELVAFGLSFLTLAGDLPGPEQRRKEWRNAALVVGVPIVLMVLLFIVRYVL